MTYPVSITPSAQDNLREAYTFTLLASNEKTAHEDKEGTGCRLALMKAAMITLENALAILGVSAPDAM